MKRHIHAAIWVMVVVSGAPVLAAHQVQPATAVSDADLVTHARALATAGQRREALTLLQAFVVRSPEDSDARVLLGTVLGWEQQYDAARRELETVLTNSPNHGDAILALIAVELASAHPERAEELARRGLLQRPTEPDYLLARARALAALNRSPEARDTLDRLFSIDPGNTQAAVLREALREGVRLWQANVVTSYEAFSDGRSAWRESNVSVGRTTRRGLVLVSGGRAERFGLADTQIGVEMYPKFRPGTYAYVAGAYSPNALLFPRYRYATDIFQNLGAGFEAAVGFRRLGFSRAVNVYVASLAKYYGDWLFAGRLFVTPQNGGVSRSTHVSVRRYLGDSGTFISARYGRGAGRDEPVSVRDLEVLDSDVGAADATIYLTSRVGLTLGGSYSREDRVEGRGLRQYALSTGLQFRF